MYAQAKMGRAVEESATEKSFITEKERAVVRSVAAKMELLMRLIN